MYRSLSTSILMAIACSTTTTAFTPSSTFLHKPHRNTPASSSTSYTSASSSTALSMNLFDRFSRVAKSNLNNVLKNLEDPEKIMNQALEDMQNDLVKIRQSYAEVTATQRRLLKQKEQADTMANDWYARAQLALKKGNEELAREALSRRQQQLDAGQNLQDQIDTQNSSIDKLYEGMQALESKILESKAKKEQMIARARTAQSTQKVNDMLGGMTGSTSADAFKRMEEKVEALEASAEVSAEMGALGGKALPGSAESNLEKEFAMLEGASAVEDELSKMKNLLAGSSSEDGGASAASGSKNSALDDDFEKLKRDAGL